MTSISKTRTHLEGVSRDKLSNLPLPRRFIINGITQHLDMEPETHKTYILPPEMWNRIFSYLDLQSKQISRTVCSTWKHLINSPEQWSMYVPLITKDWINSHHNSDIVLYAYMHGL